MQVRKISTADVTFERTPGQDADVFTANVVDQRHGGPVTIGYGRYAPDQSIDKESPWTT
jgi:ethanolamine utilization protein EutQ (cupin superfamily)